MTADDVREIRSAKIAELSAYLAEYEKPVNDARLKLQQLRKSERADDNSKLVGRYFIWVNPEVDDMDSVSYDCYGALYAIGLVGDKLRVLEFKENGPFEKRCIEYKTVERDYIEHNFYDVGEGRPKKVIARMIKPIDSLISLTLPKERELKAEEDDR